MGKVYIAESPLYEITSKSGIRFAYNENEKAQILKEIEGEKYTIQRSKGLGENEPDMMNKTTMNPASRRLIRVTPDDEQATYIMFNTLLGDDLAARKDYIARYGADYIDLADIWWTHFDACLVASKWNCTRANKKTVKTIIKDYVIITIASFFYGVAISQFLDPNNIAPGGVSGLSMVINRIIPIEVGTLIMMININ